MSGSAMTVITGAVILKKTQISVNAYTGLYALSGREERENEEEDYKVPLRSPRYETARFGRSRR